MCPRKEHHPWNTPEYLLFYPPLKPMQIKFLNLDKYSAMYTVLRAIIDKSFLWSTWASVIMLQYDRVTDPNRGWSGKKGGQEGSVAQVRKCWLFFSESCRLPVQMILLSSRRHCQYTGCPYQVSSGSRERAPLV